ncbi:MAG: hypothetical protein HWD85_09780 [Flavobacteriaceae bacterium]|nr:hypothetical protein [Flavobacteriaceae bacterium]
MKFKLTTYKTLVGTKDVLEIPKKKSGQWIIYQNDKPAYFVDCFDFKEESNLIMNHLILSGGKTINQVINNIKRKKNISLSLPKKPFLEIEVKSEEKELQLKPLPEEWLQ